MSLTRSQAATEMAAEYAELFALLGVGTTDTGGALKEPIDRALRAIGTAPADVATATVGDDDLDGFLSVLRLWTLRRLRQAAATWVDIDVQGLGVSKKRGQLIKNLDGLIADALTEVSAYGLGVVNSWQAETSASLDIYEPEAVA